MAFRGWPAEALEFYEGLEADNSKPYWTDHKAVYEASVLAPMEELLGELEGEFGGAKVFRPYRDVRFSADKSPYKTAIGATLERGGYVQFSAEGLAAARGHYTMAADQLDRFRRAVDEERTGRELVAIIAKLERTGASVQARESLKRAPRGYAPEHARVELLRGKGLHAWRQWPVEPWLETAAAKEHVVGFLRAARPLAQWLDRHVGASDLPERSR
jgi:uncharacterized protein (TIGR02453 family)